MRDLMDGYQKNVEIKNDWNYVRTYSAKNKRKATNDYSSPTRPKKIRSPSKKCPSKQLEIIEDSCQNYLAQPKIA